MTVFGDVRVLSNPRAIGGPRSGDHPRPGRPAPTTSASTARPAPVARPVRRTTHAPSRPIGHLASRQRIEPARQHETERTRRALRSPVRAGRRPHPVGRVLALVLLSFMVGLVYLAQTVHIAATNYEVDQLLAQRDLLTRQVQTIEASLVRLNTEPTVVERAQQLGLDALTGRIRIASR